MTHKNILQYLNFSSEQINKVVQKNIDLKASQARSINGIPFKMVDHFKKLSVGGKKIRGTLVKLGYLAGSGKENENILQASASIEIFHTGILIHDDIMDKSSQRRGEITTHELFSKGINKDYGHNMAISLGDFSFYLSIEMLLKSNFNVDLVIKATQLYSEFAQRLVHGQVLDISTETLSKIDQDYILKIYRYKTAEYTGVMPLLIGYILSGINDEKIYNALVNYGTCLGWAFQIHDDVLDIYGVEESIQKPLGGDIIEGKNTLLNYYLNKYGTKDQIEFISSLKSKSFLSQEQLEQVKKIYADCGALNKVKQIAIDYVEQGKKEISIISKNPEITTLLNELIDYMLYRIS